MNALEIKNLVKKYPATKLTGEKIAVDNVSFTVKKGEFFGFLGPNGAGKTTTINAITGIGTFPEGEIKVFGYDVVKDYREARKKIGLSPQEFNVDMFVPPKDTLYYVGGFFGMSKKERIKRADEVLKELGFGREADLPFRALSGGFKRRVMLARAMMHDPEILILDEPTSGVDVELRHDLWRILQELNKKGKTIFLTTHYLEEAEKLCDRIGIIFNGKLVTLDSKRELIKDGKSIEEHYLSMVTDGKNGIK
ncbi:ABC transporter ATP-binding protein [Candidatus Giovannonibacteria bacterium]|nr:ABC transporter ATP-binding protein [Candidatus Giovannonibacteria bacterium]